MSNENLKPYGKINGEYKLVWNDEFDGDTLDKNKWSTEVTKIGGRNVLVVEDTENTIKVKDGALILTAYKDNNGVYHVPNSVHTKTTMNYKYGYVEIKAKVPLDIGCSASFWTQSVYNTNSLINIDDFTAPQIEPVPYANDPQSIITSDLNHYAEVDIFKVFQKNEKQCIGGNILKNFPGHPEKNWYATPMPWTQQMILPDEEYHIYGYEWTPTEINLYFDGEIYAHFDITTSWTENSIKNKGLPGWNQDVTGFIDKSGTAMECFNEAQYLIFNHHLYYKDQFAASTSVTKNVDFSSIDFIIDYCRVYQTDECTIATK